MKDENAKIVIAFILIVLLVIVGPMVTIWSLNTLFPMLAIPLTFDTWLATMILFGGGIAAKSK